VVFHVDIGTPREGQLGRSLAGDLRGPLRQHVIQAAQIRGAGPPPVGTAGRGGRAYQLPRLGWVIPKGVQNLFNLDRVLGEMRGKSMEPETDVD
jgi:hypothetical protein